MTAAVADLIPDEKDNMLKPVQSFSPTLKHPRSLLRFISCGSVDDGKSTLIGRLLLETEQVPEDQLANLVVESRRYGTTGDIDPALLLDGLSAEREQGITIDVAYRYFATAKRAFIVADTPGHRQYTRNMASGASTADLAILLIDVRSGIVTQTRRHSIILSMLGVRHILLAVNKMDLAGFNKAEFMRIEHEFNSFATKLGFYSIHCIPLSARHGDNVTSHSDHMPWYAGPCLLSYIEEISIDSDKSLPFCMPVQLVNRARADFRGFAGTLLSGKIRPGDEVISSLSGQTARIKRIVTSTGDLAIAHAGQAVTITLDDEIDISRGDVLQTYDSIGSLRQIIYARLLWLDKTPLTPGRSYLLKLGTATVNAIPDDKFLIFDIETGQTIEGSELADNEIGILKLRLDRPLIATSYHRLRGLGGFILIDKISNSTVALGLVEDQD